MTKAAPITQAMMERAIRAAKKQGCAAVVLDGGSIKFLVDEAVPVQPSPQIEGENTCDALFGEVSD